MSAKSNSHISDYFLYHKDGLLDLLLGLYLLIAGGAMAAELVFLSGIWVAVFIPLWISARKTITMRRVQLSSVSIPTSRQTGTFTAALVGMFVLGTLIAFTFIAGIDSIPWLRSFLSQYIHLSIGAGIAFLLFFLSAILATRRFALYGFVCAAIFSGAHLIGWPFFISMLILGSLMSAAGLVIVIRFLAQHPLPTQ